MYKRQRYEPPFFAFAGVADSTPTRPRLGTDRPGAVIPELPRNARSPTFASPRRTQPPPSSYGAIRVSSARKAPSPTVVRLGSASTVDTSEPRPTRIPSARSHSGVTSPA